MRDNARTESVEEIRASSVKQQPTSPSTHEYERAMLTARSYSLGWAGHGIGLACTFKPMSCLFSPVVAGALQRPVAAPLGPRPRTGCGSRESEDSPLPQHCCCDKLKYARLRRIQRRRHRLGQTSCAYRSPPELR